KLRALGIKLHTLPDACSRITKLRTFRRMVLEIKPEVVHSYSFYTNFATFWATLGTKTIPIGGVRCDFDWARDDTGALMGRLSGRWPRRQVFNSCVLANSVQKSNRFFVPKECFVVRNGLDLELFHPLPLASRSKVQILGVGSLLSVKR